MDEENTTNVRVRCETDYVKVQFDPPIKRIRFIKFCPLVKFIGPPLNKPKDGKLTENAFFSIRSSIIDENKNYSDIHSPVVTGFDKERETISIQKRSKNHHFFLGEEPKVATKTDEFVSGFYFRIENQDGKPYRKSSSTPLYICLKLYH